MTGSLDAIQEAICVNCWSGDRQQFREMLFAGVAARCGHYESDIRAFVGERDISFLVTQFEKQLPLSHAENQYFQELRQQDEPFLVTSSSCLYRKFVLVTNYLSILSIFGSASHRHRYAH